jgi:branched-subunit amino acid aminotransferase/4-amino-4-deoxychorismate lyase
VTAPLAWVDGRLVPTAEASVSVLDRGFLLGDGVFETLRARNGVAIDWDAHVTRLHESAAVMSIELPLADEALLAGISDLLAAAALDDAAIRVTVSRGASPTRGLLPTDRDRIEATVAIVAWSYEPPSAALVGRGVHVVVSSVRRDPSSPLAGVKSTSRADHVFARLEASRAAADDALFLTLDGRLSETTTANVWVVNGRRLATPGRDAAILAGTTRAWLLDVAPGLDLGVALAHESDLQVADLLGADEAFLSSSVAGILPLTAVEGEPIGTGQPGSLTIALREGRERWIADRSPAR